MGGKSDQPEEPDLDKLAEEQKKLGQDGYQNALGGGGQWVEDPNSPSGFTYKESLGDGSQQIVNNSMGALGQPVDLSNDTVTKQIMDEGNKMMQPYFQQQEGSLDQKLANQGIDPNSEAGKAAKMQQSDSESRAMNQWLLNGRQQQVSEDLAGRNQSLQELEAIMGLNSGHAPGTGGTPDLVGAGMQQYQNEMNNYNQQQQGMGNLFSNIGSIAGGVVAAGLL